MQPVWSCIPSQSGSPKSASPTVTTSTSLGERFTVVREGATRGVERLGSRGHARQGWAGGILRAQRGSIVTIQVSQESADSLPRGAKGEGEAERERKRGVIVVASARIRRGGVQSRS